MARSFKGISRRARRCLWAGAATLATPGAVWLLAVLVVDCSANAHTVVRTTDVPTETYAVVFGAGLTRTGHPSPILQDRLDGAIELYREGRVGKLLMSGDDRYVSHNEPASMQRYAMAHGVPRQNIMLDFAGRDTYDTCYRAKHLFGINRAIFVTQGFHAPRAVFIGRGLGIDATAYAVSDAATSNLRFCAREYLADIKAVWDVAISHRLPYVDQSKRAK